MFSSLSRSLFFSLTLSPSFYFSLSLSLSLSKISEMQVRFQVKPHVRLIRWIPQNELLNHPKTVLFVSHGGLKRLGMLFLESFQLIYFGLAHARVLVTVEKSITKVAALKRILRTLCFIRRYTFFSRKASFLGISNRLKFSTSTKVKINRSYA